MIRLTLRTNGRPVHIPVWRIVGVVGQTPGCDVHVAGMGPEYFAVTESENAVLELLVPLLPGGVESTPPPPESGDQS